MSDWDAVRPYFDAEATAHVATVMPDGAPHSVPVWVDVNDGMIVFLTIAGSRKDKNLAIDPRVAISVTNPDNSFDMAFVRGTVVERISDDRVWPIIDALAVKYTGEPYPERSRRVVFRVRPDVAWAMDYERCRRPHSARSAFLTLRRGAAAPCRSSCSG